MQDDHGYNPAEDGLLLVGLASRVGQEDDATQTLDPADLLAMLEAKTAGDFFELAFWLAIFAVGLADALTGDRTAELLQQISLTKGSLGTG